MNPLLRWMPVLSLAMLPTARSLAADADEPATWSVPVRVLASPTAPTDPVSPGMLAAAATANSSAGEPTGGLPPQYRAGSEPPLDGGARPEDPTVRFIVPLVERPILVEARITIDGRPFGMAREQRIDRIIEELAKPVVTAPPPAQDAVSPMPEPQKAELQTTPDKSEASTEPTEEPDDGAAGDAAQPVSAPVPAVDGSWIGRLRRYVQATGRVPQRDELRWILTHWAAGPTLLIVNDNFQSVRASRSPLFAVLDRDEDGVIDTDELAGAEQTLLRYDRNQDDVLSFDEITVAATRTPADSERPLVAPAPLIPLDELARPPLLRRLTQQYGESFAPPSGAADVRIDVALDSSDPGRSQLQIQSLSVPADQVTIHAHAGAMAVRIAGTMLEISAVQPSASEAIDQVSIGAVRDGYPLLPIADRDQDGRLTIRELRQVATLIAGADPDHDGRIEAAEILPTVRVVVGYGATAHQPLTTVRSIYPPDTTPPATPPEWFTRMDRNQDGDLTPREFLGGKESFADLDGDSDGLVNAAEALAGS